MIEFSRASLGRACSQLSILLLQLRQIHGDCFEVSASSVMRECRWSDRVWGWFWSDDLAVARVSGDLALDSLKRVSCGDAVYVAFAQGSVSISVDNLAHELSGVRSMVLMDGLEEVGVFSLTVRCFRSNVAARCEVEFLDSKMSDRRSSLDFSRGSGRGIGSACVADMVARIGKVFE